MNEEILSAKSSQRSLQVATVSCRLIVTRAGNSQVLVMRNGASVGLPSVEIPEWERAAPHLTGLIRENWGARTICLFRAGVEDIKECSSQTRYYVLEALDTDWTPPREMAWHPAGEIDDEDFQRSPDFEVLTSVLAQAASYNRGSCFFADSGYLEKLRAWVAARLKEHGLTLGDDWTQYNMGPFFCLIRFATDGHDVWFKAVGKPNLREYAMATKLAELYPAYVPGILGFHPEWHGWLMRDASGGHLDARCDLRLWERAAESLALLQLASVADRDILLATGFADLRLDYLDKAADFFFAAIVDLMALQTVSYPRPLTGLQLEITKIQLKRSLQVLEEIGLPDALVHLDLSSGNILVCPDRAVFLDWLHAGIGLPLLAVEYLLSLVQRLRPDEPNWPGTVLEAYRRVWEAQYSSDHLTRALRFTPIVAAMAFAVACLDWRKDPQDMSIHSAKLLRSIARRMYAEAVKLQQ